MKFCLSICCIMLLLSCGKKENSELAIFRSSYRGFESSSAIIKNNTAIIYLSLQDKLSDYHVADYARTWNSKAGVVKGLTTEITDYISALEDQIKQRSGKVKWNGSSTYIESNHGTIKKIFNSDGKAKELYDKLRRYEVNVFAIDSFFIQQFGNNTTVMEYGFADNKDHAVDFEAEYFTDIPAIAALAQLSKFKNAALVMENKLVSYCHSRSTPGCGMGIRDDSFRPIILLDKSYVKAGETIIVTGGLGTFTTQASPVMHINGKSIPAQRDGGVSIYKFKASAEAGKHNAKVIITFTRPDGTKGNWENEINYEVAQ